MKLKIKIKRLDKSVVLPEIIDKGDWIDLRAAEEVHLKAPQSDTLKTFTIDGVRKKYRDVSFDSHLVKLGVAMELPDGFEAVMLPRSGSYNRFGITLGNSQGVLDNSFCGNNDEWKFNAVAFRDAVIYKGDRICQFRIQLSQKATFWQKLKWLISSGIEIVEVDEFNNKDRNGFGSTGIN